jgi:hypothetical protein
VKNAHKNKLSYPESVMTSLYNKYPTIEEGIDISFEKTDSNYKIIDFTSIGILPDSLANQF